MDNYVLGNALKRIAKASGNFVQVDIVNVYNTLDTLSRFFHGKKHEWIAICFLDENFTCNLIWFNKGSTHQEVSIGLSPLEAIKKAQEYGHKYIIVAHNHPISSHDLPNYGRRKLNIQASYAHKRALLNFSNQDISSGSKWVDILSKEGIAYVETVFVAGTYKTYGDRGLIDNYNMNKPKACFIATSVFGQRSWETLLLRSFRDRVLIKHKIGTTLCKFYYLISPSIAKRTSQNAMLRMTAKTILRLIIISICLIGRGRSLMDANREPTSYNGK